MELVSNEILDVITFSIEDFLFNLIKYIRHQRLVEVYLLLNYLAYYGCSLWIIAELLLHLD